MLFQKTLLALRRFAEQRDPIQLLCRPIVRIGGAVRQIAMIRQTNHAFA